MARHQRITSPRALALAGTAILGILGTTTGCGGGGSVNGMAASTTPTFTATSLVSDQAGATHQDTNLVNPWGIAYGPATRFWVSDQGTGLSTVYDGLGSQLVPPVVVTVPTGLGSAGGGPTGVVFNGTGGFLGDLFIFATVDGTLSGWSAGTAATLRVDHASSGAVYTGLAQGSVGATNYLYAANFTGGGIDVYDTSYAAVNLGAGSFTDPALPAGYYPFGIQNLGGQIYVTYANRIPPSVHANPGAGLGYVDVFNPDGTLVGRFAGQGMLNAPWGLALAPAGFTPFGGALLVGNFGDGHITAYDPATKAVLGQLSGAGGTPLAISGLWGIIFGNGANAGSASQLYFAAGSQGETHGLFGTISVTQPAGSTGTGGTGY